MKKVSLILEFYRKNIIAVFFLLVFMSASIFNMVELFGYLGYKTFSLYMMEDLDISDGIYCMPASECSNLSTVITPEKFAVVEKTICPASSYVQYKGTLSLNVFICDQIFIESFHFADQGQWLTEKSITDPTAPIEVVVGGALLSSVQVGDIIELDVVSLDGTFLRVQPAKVIGKDVEPTMVLSLGTVSDRITAADICTNVTNCIYMTEESFRIMYGENSERYFMRPSNFIVCFRDDADESSKQEVLTLAEKSGRYLTFDEIRSYSKDDISAFIKKELPEPMFMLFLSVFAMISVSVLLTYKQMKDYSIYYLVGASRKACFLNTLVAIFSLNALSGLINAIYLMVLFNNLDAVKTENSAKYFNYIVVNDSYLWIALFVIGASILSVLIPFAILKKQTTIEIYGRRQ